MLILLGSTVTGAQVAPLLDDALASPAIVEAMYLGASFTSEELFVYDILLTLPRLLALSFSRPSAYP